MAADNLWESAFGGSTGGLFGGFFGGGGSAPTMSGTGLGAGTGGLSFPMFADGTASAPGGMAIVGERGPELVNLPRGAQVVPNHELGKGGSQQNLKVDIGVSLDNDGNLQAYVKNVSQQMTASGIGQLVGSPQFADHVANASKKARSQRKMR
jgi:hypothetical protein